jgi:hypothetical protein
VVFSEINEHSEAPLLLYPDVVYTIWQINFDVELYLFSCMTTAFGHE